MDRSQPPSDRLSKLEDSTLGHILSFLPAKEAARSALLSSRWRHVFAGVHTISLEEPESPIRERDDEIYSPGWGPPPDPNQPPPFSSAVSAALLARHRRRGAAPLRALRIAKGGYHKADSSTLDQWVSYAVQQAATGALDLDLRLCCRSWLCPHRPYCLRRDQQAGVQDATPEPTGESPSPIADAAPEPAQEARPQRRSVAKTATGAESDDDGDLSSSSEDDLRRYSFSGGIPWWQQPPPVYTVTRVIFSCADLRSLSLSSCLLAPPATVALPSLETLLLSHVPDPAGDVERLISACPRLADLTLEACDAVTALSIGGGTRLRRLALRCCHKLAAVAFEASELAAFEYRGAVPDTTFLTMHGGSRRVAYCKADICGEEVTSTQELINLRQFLQPFVNAKHLHLESPRVGFGLDKDVHTRLPIFSNLRHLQLRGCLPDDAGAEPPVWLGMARAIPKWRKFF